MSSSTPTTEDLLAYAAGDLVGPERGRIEAYLAEHHDAAIRVARYRATIAYMRSDDSIDPPQRVLDRAKAIFTAETRQSFAPGWLERLDVIIARLVFDSRLQPAGVRYAGSPFRIQLCYEHKEITVDLQAECEVADLAKEGPIAGDGQPGERKIKEDDVERLGVRPPASPVGRFRRWQLLGQVAGPSPLTGVPIRLINELTGASVAETTIDEKEMFAFEVEPGQFALCAELESGVLVLPEIELQ